MSGIKRIMNGNRTRSTEPHVEPEKPTNINSPSSNKKVSLFRKPRQTRTAQSTEDDLPSTEDLAHHATKTRHNHLHVRFGKTSPQATTEVENLVKKCSLVSKDGAASPSKRRLSSPHAPGDLFRLGQLPLAGDVSLEALLEQSVRHVTIKKAAAARYSVVTTLNNLRELSVLSGVVDQYVSYALTCWDIAEHLKKKGTNVSEGVVWASGLLDGMASGTEYNGGFGLEAALVLTLSALCKLRCVVETAASLGMDPDQTLVAQIKSLQVAAGMFDYARSEVTPKAMADFVGNPPPELVPEVSSLFSSLCLCLAQALHVRRAVLSGMSAATLAKLSTAAKDLAAEVLSKHNKVTQLGVELTTDVKTVANDIMTLTTGWTLQYLGATTQASANSGAKITSLREAIARLKSASNSRIVGKVAALELQALDKQLEDAVNENQVVYQHVIPNAKDLQLPQGRSLVSATKYDAARIPMANTAPRK